MKKAEHWIQHLDLKPHPEGGFYRETYRSNVEVSGKHLPVGYHSERRLATSIYYLLRTEDKSRLHRLRSDELWFYHSGSALTVYYIDTEGKKHTIRLGSDANKAEHLSVLIPGGCLFCAEVQNTDAYGLVSCVVTPGFEFDDFEMFSKDDLLQAYPKHIDLIEKFG